MPGAQRIELRPPSSRPVLLYGGTVLTMDAEATVLPRAEILIQNGRIAAIGRSLTLIPGTRLIDIQGHLVLPGLIQGHIHLGQTFFRGLGEGRHLLPWLRERIWPLEAAHDDESAYWCSLQGAAECLLGGTTTVQDIGLGPGFRGLLQALLDSRMRGITGKCLMDDGAALPTGLRQRAEETLVDTESLGLELPGRPGGRVSYSLNPRFILTCSDRLWLGIRELADRHGWPIHTHALEHRDEAQAVRQLKGGRDEIEYFDEHGILDADLRIAHGVQLTEGHYPKVVGRRVGVVHCPAANLKLGSGVADVVGHRRAGIPVGVGCDGAGCNNGLDVLEELRLAALLQANARGPGSFSGVDALRLATSEGARVLGLGDRIGTVEQGKDADLTVLALDRPEMAAAEGVDPHDLVVFGASRSQVRHVFVAGEQLVEDGRLTHLDLPTLLDKASAARNALVARAQIDA
ncbi:MAG: amidohydrolase family protein [Acidobacteriota bacterium]